MLARRILANSWTSGSARLGGLGWWLLGLVFGARERREGVSADKVVAREKWSGDERNGHLVRDWMKQTPMRARNGDCGVDAPRCTPVDYARRRTAGGTRSAVSGDARGPSRKAVSTCSGAGVSTRPRTERMGTSLAGLVHAHPENSCSKGRRDAIPPIEQHVPTDRAEPESRHAFKLWCKFSLALVLAIGVAVVQGPGVLLVGSPNEDDGGDGVDAEREEDNGSMGKRLHYWTEPTSDERYLATARAETQRNVLSSNGKRTLEYPFVENLTIRDFEVRD